MNWDQLESKWDQVKGEVKVQWGKLTNDDITIIQGKKEKLLGKLIEHYNYTTEQAKKELSSFLDNFKQDEDDKQDPNNKANP